MFVSDIQTSAAASRLNVWVWSSWMFTTIWSNMQENICTGFSLKHTCSALQKVEYVLCERISDIAWSALATCRYKLRANLFISKSTGHKRSHAVDSPPHSDRPPFICLLLSLLNVCGLHVLEQIFGRRMETWAKPGTPISPGVTNLNANDDGDGVSETYLKSGM